MKKFYSLTAFCFISYYTISQPTGTLAPPSYSKCTPTLIPMQGNNSRYLFGTDNNYPQITKKVQMFEIAENANFNIVGAIVWIGYLKVNGTAGNVSFEVWDFCGFVGMNLGSKRAGFPPNQDSPESPIGNATVKSISTLKASICLDNANVVIFDKPINVNNNTGSTCMNKIGVGIDFANIGDDLFGLYSTNSNEGALNTNNIYKELALEYDKSYANGSGAWYTLLASTDGAINADMLIFPIIDMNAYNTGKPTNVCAGSSTNGIIQDESFFNGIKLNPSYPNPTHNKCLIEYEIENNASVTLGIYDMEGKRIKFFDEGKQIAGFHSRYIDVSNMQSGNYIYILSADEKVLAKQMSLMK